MDANGVWEGLMDQPRPRKPRVLVIGAGSRGTAYARAIENSTDAILDCVAEPVDFKRRRFGRRYIWKNLQPRHDQQFRDWQGFLKYELDRRQRADAGEDTPEGINVVLVCMQDAMHHEVVLSLAPLHLHTMCEKPLSTSLDRCLRIYSSLLPDGPGSSPKTIFGIGHVLRYSPHNMLLRSLLLEENVIGDILSLEHTEPVGWWHFSHSYVRGNWRKESTAAPSLLTKSCHDIDFILWLLTASPDGGSPHHPSSIASTGALSYFRKSRKPAGAGHATNCLDCSIESSCSYSSKKVYWNRHLAQGHTGWPVKIVDPEIEDCYRESGPEIAKNRLLNILRDDYDASSTSKEDVESRPWFGRCVWESDNDVCDDQYVTITWEDENAGAERREEGNDPQRTQGSRFAKTATFHMIAHTEAQCERRGRIYGTAGEIAYDSKTIRVYDFATDKATLHQPLQPGGGHGGGDDGLMRQFISGVEAVINGRMNVAEAQKTFIGCTLEDVVRSHAVVFASEEARRENKVIEWQRWWLEEVEKRLFERKGWEVDDRSQESGTKELMACPTGCLQ